MYIRIDLSVFFVTQNVGETSGVFTERKAKNTLLFVRVYGLGFRALGVKETSTSITTQL